MTLPSTLFHNSSLETCRREFQTRQGIGKMYGRKFHLVLLQQRLRPRPFRHRRGSLIGLHRIRWNLRLPKFFSISSLNQKDNTLRP